jgi:hypothetical protein
MAAPQRLRHLVVLCISLRVMGHLDSGRITRAQPDHALPVA